MNQATKVAIITGSATGVGSATAKQLATLGWNVVINYTRSKTEAEETEKICREAGVDTLLIQADVSKDEDCQQMVAATVDKWGHIDALVNNAGMTMYCDYGDLNGLQMEDFQRIYAVNVVGAYQMARAVVPHMKKAGEGSIVNTSSISALTGVGSSMAYAASKGAMNTLTLSLAQALGPEIRVNAVCPGFIQGRWIKNGVGEERYEALRSAIESVAPLQKTATPEEVADAIVFFVTGAKIATAQLMVLDGGYHLNQRPPGM